MRAGALPTPTEFDAWGVVGFSAFRRHVEQIQWLRENGAFRFFLGVAHYLLLPAACVLAGHCPPNSDWPYILPGDERVREYIRGLADVKSRLEVDGRLRLECDYTPFLLNIPENGDRRIMQAPADVSRELRNGEGLVYATRESGADPLEIQSEQQFFAEISTAIDPPEGLISPSDPPVIRLFLVGTYHREVQ